MGICAEKYGTSTVSAAGRTVILTVFSVGLQGYQSEHPGQFGHALGCRVPIKSHHQEGGELSMSDAVNGVKCNVEFNPQ